MTVDYIPLHLHTDNILTLCPTPFVHLFLLLLLLGNTTLSAGGRNSSSSSGSSFSGVPSFRFSKADEAMVEVLEGATDSMESVISSMVESGQAAAASAAASSSTNIPFSLPGSYHKSY